MSVTSSTVKAVSQVWFYFANEISMIYEVLHHSLHVYFQDT